MSVIGSNILAGASSSQGYQISRSVRLRSSASAYLRRTNATTGTDPLKFTVSGWVKRGLSTASYFPLVGSATGTNAFDFIGFQADNLVFRIRNSSSVDLVHIESSAVYRDFSAWYHIVAVYDSANATSTERVKLYVNGVQLTAFGTATYPSLNQGLAGDFLTDMQIGRTNTNSSNQNYGDGYLTEVNFIDGQALDPSSFGETDAVTGVWKPKKYAGTYGTNGWYLNFSDNSAATAAAIGADYSGNGNNWTPNNISVTAGVTYDSMLDVPTQWADGGNGRGNYAVLNPLSTNSGFTLSNGNLDYNESGAISACRPSPATMAISSGKWYWEVNTTTVGGGSYTTMLGIWDADNLVTSYTQNRVNGFAYATNGDKVNASATASYGSAMSNADVIGVAFDADAGTITFYKNNTSQGTAFTGISGSYAPVVCFNSGGTSYSMSGSANFGQRPFSYTPPTGFKALNTLNLPEPTILKGNQFFDVSLYSGNSSTQSITNSGSMQPDLVWGKARSASGYDHFWYDSQRGTTKWLGSSSTSAEQTISGVTAFNSNGFTLGSDANSNQTGNTYVGWQWKANGTPAVTNTAGSITSQVSAGANQGFSIVTYTGTGSTGTVGHGLGVAPSMIISKNRSAVENWRVAHIGLTNMASWHCNLDTTQAQTNSGAAVWNNTTPTSNIFGVGTDTSVSGNGNLIVAYCFAAVAGYSAFGKYTGNGSADGTFVFLGFRPRFVMIKRTDAVDNWAIFDTSRLGYNADNNELLANTSSAEGTADFIDILSNGFKNRNSDSRCNASGGTYIYAAFAEVPFRNALAR